MLKSKIHRATVTEANVHYEGSLTLDVHLLHAADIVPYEEVHVWNVTRGTRFRTYAMIGEIGSGVVCANGAAALLVEPGDLVIIATFTTIGKMLMIMAVRIAGTVPAPNQRTKIGTTATFGMVANPISSG